MVKSAKFWGIAAVLVALSSPLRAEEPTAETVVATVNGTDITLGQMIALRDSLPPQYLAMPDDALFNGILEQLIQQVALADSVKDKVTLRDTLSLENQRLTYMSGKALNAVADAAVTDEALQKLYDEKYAKAEPGKEYKAAHILVATEQEAKDIKAALDAGGDFAKLAAEKSSDSSAQNGGDLGWFGLGMMVKPFEDAVLALEPGKISDPVQTDFGWHIIKLEDRKMGAAQPYDQVKPAIRNVLLRKKVQEVMASVRDSSKIEILDDDLKKFMEEAAKQRKTLEDAQGGQAQQAPAADAGSDGSGKGDLMIPQQ